MLTQLDYASISLALLGFVSLTIAYASNRQKLQAEYLLDKARNTPYNPKTIAEEHQPISFSLLDQKSEAAKKLRAPIDAYPLLMWPILQIGGFAATLTLAFLVLLFLGASMITFIITITGFLLLLWRLNAFEVSGFLSRITEAGVEQLDNRDETILSEVRNTLSGNVRYYAVLGIIFLVCIIPVRLLLASLLAF